MAATQLEVLKQSAGSSLEMRTIETMEAIWRVCTLLEETNVTLKAMLELLKSQSATAPVNPASTWNPKRGSK